MDAALTAERQTVSREAMVVVARILGQLLKECRVRKECGKYVIRRLESVCLEQKGCPGFQGVETIWYL